MADSIRERIVQDLVEAAEAVNRSAGYEVDIKKVERVRRTGYQAHEYPAVNVFEGPERKECGPMGLTTCLLPVVLEITVWDATAFASAANRAMAAVVKAVLTDRTRGALAVDTQETGNKMFLDETDATRPIGGFRVDLTIQYRHKDDDPYAPI